MRRREFLTASVIATLAVSLPVAAKEPARIAVLGSGTAEAPNGVNQMTWLRNGLRMVGLVEGQDFTFDVRNNLGVARASTQEGRSPQAYSGLQERRFGKSSRASNPGRQF